MLTQRVNGIVMLGLLLAGGGMSAFVIATPELRAVATRPLPGYSYLDGSLTSSLEGTYKEELPVKSGSAELLNAFTLSLFGDGRKGVLVGKSGWLFSSEEYAWTGDSSSNLTRNLQRIAEIAILLRTNGITLQIALIPEKADIYSDLLVEGRPAIHSGQYEAVRARLIALTGVEVPDLRAPLLAGRQTEEVFFPTDTHWTVAGAGTAARVLAASFPSEAFPAAAFDLKADPLVHHSGDLKRFIELGPFAALLPATTDEVVPIVAVAEGGDVDDFLSDPFVESAPALALVGTSYSANALWSFEPQLKAALGIDVVNLADEGRGPMVPMEAFVKQLERGEIAVKGVIWEMPLRYLDDKPDAAGGKSSGSSV